MTWDQLFDSEGPKKDYDDAARGPILRSDAALLGALCNYVRPRAVLEYGSLDGHSASVFARFAESVTCVEAENFRPGLNHTCEQNPNVRAVHADMRTWVPPNGAVYDLVYLDASHAAEDNLVAFELFKPFLAPDALLVCHDTATWPDPNMWGEEFAPVRRAAVAGERAFCDELERRGWSVLALGSGRTLRHGLTILQRRRNWE